MALKALDQRMAGSSGSNPSPVNTPTSQPLRVPPAAAASRADSPAMPSSPVVGKERQNSGIEADIGEVSNPKENSR